MRVRVEMRNADGTPVVPAIPSKQRLLEEAVKLIPTLPGRQGRLQQIEAAKAQVAKQRLAAAGAPKAARSKEDRKEERKLAKKQGKGGALK